MTEKGSFKMWCKRKRKNYKLRAGIEDQNASAGCVADWRKKDI